LRLLQTIAVVVLLAAGTFATSDSASAHTSSYCGHGTDGYLWISKWTGHISNMHYPYHYNFYNHYQSPSWNVAHTATTACPNGV
jgi:hypothetical protein